VGEIRPDIHERFVAIVARADAKLKVEQKAGERRLAAALAGDKHEGRPWRRSRDGASRDRDMVSRDSAAHAAS